ncbi:MAG: hypothetical protein HY908_34455 [Myxococcales bacterium]|nr:hypothetical protein [Myxococcales bacterium]
MASILVERSVRLAASPAEIWPLIIDTDRLNRLLGLKPVRYTPIDEPGSGARLLAETRLGGFHTVYEEQPYEWTYRKRFGVLRRFRGGPLAWMRVGWRLEPLAAEEGGAEAGTELAVTFEALPRLAVLRPIAWLNLRRAAAGMLALGRAIDAHVRDGAPSPFLKPVSPSDDAALARAHAALRERGVEETLAALLVGHVRDAADADCVKMRPYELADLWQRDRREVLVAFLHAVPAGLLVLSWAIVCPSCRTASQEVRSLEEVSTEGHCQLCDIAFELELDRAVEATFAPSPVVRTVPSQMFCIAGPARTPHVLTQAMVPAGGEARVEAPPEPGRYRFFVRGGARATVELVRDGPAEAAVAIDAAHVTPVEVALRPGGTLVVTNADAEGRHVKIEHLAYASAAATAHAVSTVPEFRAIFSRDLLKRGTPLKVARVAVLFTDLTGSTALYSAVGDAAAFRLVDDHFDVLREAVASAGGTVVKTMGDAVMASFPDDLDCVRGAVACLERFEAWRHAREHGALVGLKLGLYTGACYVVTANGILDYFGQTVNVAARLQHLAGSGEIVLERTTRAALPPELAGQLVAEDELDVRVKGVAEPIPIVKMRLRGQPT